MAHCAQSPAFLLHQVTYQFATGLTLFGPLTLSLEPSLCGLVGRNGCGKTSMLRLLAGHDAPAFGHIERVQQHRILSTTTLAELLGYRDIFAARQRVESGDYQLEDLEHLDGSWDLQELLAAAFAEARLPAFAPDKRAAELSGGERVRTLLCAAFMTDADYLLLDEPTNHLDRQARTWFYDKLSQRRGGALVATHDRELLAMMPRILELTLTGLRNYGGNYDDYQRQRQAEQQAAQAALEHATTEQRACRRTRMCLQDASQRRSAQTLRTVDSLNIASFSGCNTKRRQKRV